MHQRLHPDGPAGFPPGYQAILDLPDNLVGELINGELVVSPRPAPPHIVCGSTLFGTLYAPFQRGLGGPGGWFFVVEPEFHFGPNVVVPDLAGWRSERMPQLPATAYFTTPPDWVCEVLSPRSARHDRVSKLALYARTGVPFYWLIDPIGQTLEVLVRREDVWQVAGTFGGSDRVAAPPFEAVPFPLAELWPLPIAGGA